MKLPGWFKQEIPGPENLALSRKFKLSGVNTVCAEARCPNITECWKKRHMTFMILGAVCTRNCRFCAVHKAPSGGLPVDKEEPERVGRAIKELGINYAVVTSVSRDDLEDGGARQFAGTIGAIRRMAPGVPIEVLIPDFLGKEDPLLILSDSAPAVIGHNLETVSRLYRSLRPEADYRLSLKVLESLKRMNDRAVTKSSLMLGLSETAEEVSRALKDLRDAGCDILTLGQYLPPSPAHEPVREFIDPQRFNVYREMALAAGFKAVLSGPLVRSSFFAENLFNEVNLCTT